MNELHIDKTHWKRTKIGDLLYKTEYNNKENASKQYSKFIKMEHLDANSLNIHRWGDSSVEDIPPTFYKIFKKGQILYPTRNPQLRRAALASFDGICGEKTLTLSLIEGCEGYIPFIAHVFHSSKFIEYATNARIGSTNPHIRWRDVADYEFLLPPKAEQKRLAELLWAADEVVEKEKREREKLQSYYFALQTNIFQNNTNCTKRLCDIANITMGQSPVGSSYNENNEGVPFLQGNSEFTDKYPVAIKYTTAPTKMANAGDILMSVRAPVGAINIADRSYCIGRGLCAISAKSGNNDYLRFLLQSKIAELDRISTGSTFKAINSNDLRNLEVPSEEQDVSLLLKCEKAITDLNGCIQRSKQIKQELINKIY